MRPWVFGTRDGRGVGHGRDSIVVNDAARVTRNLLWLLWTNPEVHSLLVDWDGDVRRFTASFRADAAGHLHTEPVSSLIKRLQNADDEFATVWADHDIERFTSRERDFNHPSVGRLTLEAHQLTLEDAPGIHLVVYTASPGSSTAARLRRLRDASTPPEAERTPPRG